MEMIVPEFTASRFTIDKVVRIPMATATQTRMVHGQLLMALMHSPTTLQEVKTSMVMESMML